MFSGFITMEAFGSPGSSMTACGAMEKTVALPLASPPLVTRVPKHASQQPSRTHRNWTVFWVRDDGAVWATWVVEGGPWRDGGLGRFPVRITPEDVATAGAPLAAIQPRDKAMYAFYVG